jgi:hypothetical protein
MSISRESPCIVFQQKIDRTKRNAERKYACVHILFMYLINHHTFSFDLVPKSVLAFCARGHFCEYLLDLIYLML